jgi:hypothetical protein
LLGFSNLDRHAPAGVTNKLEFLIVAHDRRISSRSSGLRYGP